MRLTKHVGRKNSLRKESLVSVNSLDSADIVTLMVDLETCERSAMHCKQRRHCWRNLHSLVILNRQTLFIHYYYCNAQSIPRVPRRKQYLCLPLLQHTSDCSSLTHIKSKFIAKPRRSSAKQEKHFFSIKCTFVQVCRINVRHGEAQEKKMMTGMHTVRDLYCAKCNNILGWMYVRNMEIIGHRRRARPEVQGGEIHSGEISPKQGELD